MNKNRPAVQEKIETFIFYKSFSASVHAIAHFLKLVLCTVVRLKETHFQKLFINTINSFID